MKAARAWILPQQPTLLDDLLVAGVTPTMIATQVRSGRLVRLRRAVYLAADRWPVDAGDQQVLLARAGQLRVPGAVVSHASAALAWGLPASPGRPWAEEPATLTLPGGGDRRARQGATRFVVSTLRRTT